MTEHAPATSPQMLTALLKQMCQPEISLYVLADATRLDEASLTRLSGLARAGSAPLNLYHDLDGLEIAKTGPRLLPVDSADLPEIAEMSFATHALSFLFSDAETAAVHLHLARLREALLPDGGAALFRYQDTHVTTALFDLLDRVGTGRLLGPLLAWVTPDVCGQVNILRRPRRRPSPGPLAFDRKTFDTLSARLHIHTIAAQAREVDSTLLAPYTPCEALTLIRTHEARAKTLSLNQPGDIALFCILALQLPAGFETHSPFTEAIDYSRDGHPSFGAAIDAIPPDAWASWDAQLTEQAKKP